MSQITSFPDLGSQLTQRVIQAAIEVHRHFGPGLLESIYEEALAVELKNTGLTYEKQKSIPVFYKAVKINSVLRPDFVIENKLVLELKSVDHILPIHEAQVLSYMKLLKLELGLLLNFNNVLMKDGIRRIALSLAGSKDNASK